MDEGTLTEETVLENLDEYDSMGKLSLIVLCVICCRFAWKIRENSGL